MFFPPNQTVCVKWLRPVKEMKEICQSIYDNIKPQACSLCINKDSDPQNEGSALVFFNYADHEQAVNARARIEEWIEVQHAKIWGAGGMEKPIVYLKSKPYNNNQQPFQPNQTVCLKWMRQDDGLEEVCVKLKNDFHPQAIFYIVATDNDPRYYGCPLVYFNFRNSEEALRAKYNYEKWIEEEHRKKNPSHPVPIVYIKCDGIKQTLLCFTLYVMNLYDADASSLETAFSAFGPLVQSNGLPPIRLMDGYAFVNFVNFEDAENALEACRNRQLVLQDGNSIIDAKPRSNVLYIQEIRRKLGESAKKDMTFQEAAETAASIMTADAKYKPDYYLELLMKCESVFEIDWNKRVVKSKKQKPEISEIVIPQQVDNSVAAKRTDELHDESNGRPPYFESALWAEICSPFSLDLVPPIQPGQNSFILDNIINADANRKESKSPEHTDAENYGKYCKLVNELGSEVMQDAFLHLWKSMTGNLWQDINAKNLISRCDIKSTSIRTKILSQSYTKWDVTTLGTILTHREMMQDPVMRENIVILMNERDRLQLHRGKARKMDKNTFEQSWENIVNILSGILEGVCPADCSYSRNIPTKVATIRSNVREVSLNDSKYSLDVLIAVGSMGKVYRGRDKHNETVAIKVCNARFTDENDHDMEVLMKLQLVENRNIVKILDKGISDSQLIIVMEYIEGVTLESLMQDKSLPWEDSKNFMSQLAHGVANLHYRGIIHYDLKPSNVMISSEDNRIVIIDVGMQKNDPRRPETSKARDLLRNPLYMSPEQVRGVTLDIDSRTDVWSLGVIFYKMLSGYHPFVNFKGQSGEGELSVEEACLTREEHSNIGLNILHLTPLEINGISSKCNSFIRTALKKDRKERFSDAQAMEEALSQMLKEVETESSPPSATARSSAASEIPVFSMTVDDVCRKLEQIELKEHAAAFRENSIDGSMLDVLDQLWDDLNVTKRAHQLKILKNFGLLKKNDSPVG
eukprot:745894-Hanusia_phi.AAC.2